IEAVRDAYKTEKFWGARVRFAAALGKTNSTVASEALAELLGTERDGMVCESLVRATGKFREPAIREALTKFLDSDVKLYRARAPAWEMLGAQRDDAPFERLVEAAAKDTPQDWERQG